MGIGSSKQEEKKHSSKQEEKKQEEEEMVSPKFNLVKELISNNPVVIFSKSYCGYCRLAKDVFDKIKQKYTAIELDQRTDAEEIQTVLREITGKQTVPQVFVKGKCIGGGSDVKELYDNGKLSKYFEQQQR